MQQTWIRTGIQRDFCTCGRGVKIKIATSYTPTYSMFRYIHKHMSAFVCTCASGFFIVQQLSVRHGHDQDNPFSIYNRSFHTGRQADRQAVSKLVTARPINPCNLYIYNNCCVDVDVDSVLNKKTVTIGRGVTKQTRGTHHLGCLFEWYCCW